MWYNTHYHSGAHLTSFQAFYGYQAQHLPFHQYGQVTDHITTTFCHKRNYIIQLLRANLIQAQQHMKFYADINKSERSFNVGDMVYLRVKPYKQMSMNQSKYSKLDSKYYGTFIVLARVGLLAYKLQFPEEGRIHLVFHVSVRP